ncbi:MAG: hypothetical protein IH623_10220 [Verrucomicrobia bacterium]|nr:hypothetical protein [Verrucomicrobiota bacterium]
MNQPKLKSPNDQWKALAGDGEGKSRWVEPTEAMRALDALTQIRGKPGILVLDDLEGIANEKIATEWKNRMEGLEKFFDVGRPVLPVHERHTKGGSSADDLLPIIKAEIRRLRRPLAAIVDMQWEFCDREEKATNKAPWFGLELIRLIKRAKPSLPIFVWSPIQDKHVLQRAMQLGASSCFDKPEGLRFNHDLPDDWNPKEDNILDAGKLWFRLLEWEFARYHCPPVGSSDGDFILATTPDARECRKKFLDAFELTETDLLGKSEPPVERLLRALVPDATGIEILRFFGEGQSRTERPFVVRGQTANGRWLRPVQIKLSKDWRALAREGKGYRDVFAGCLGPSVAHVLTGPYRYEEWCGMSQSFAAPEEAIRDIAAKSTRSLEDWLRKRLSEPDKCVQLVDEIFDGVLDPLYQGNLTKRAKSVFKAFDRVSPAHIEINFEAPGNSGVEPFDFTQNALSRKDARSRREMAYRRWKTVEDWWNGEGEGDCRDITGLAIESLEIDEINPNESRLRLLEHTLGVKVDLKIGYGKEPDAKKTKAAIAKRWASLAHSPIKLVGLPVSFKITRKRKNGGDQQNESRKYLLAGWTNGIEKLLEANGILESGNGVKPNNAAWQRCRDYFHPWHPIDWSEEFHIGPTHGDLNLGNILLHEKGDGLFPWLIDFDKAEDDRPVVFDLAKLEIEAYHKIAQELFWELRQIGCVENDQDSRRMLRRFEDTLNLRRVSDVSHLWEEFEKKPTAVPESLKERFEGLVAYLKQVHKRVEDLGIGGREFLLGRVVYAMCCLKFKHLYQSGKHPNAPFPAKVILWKLEALLEALDAENGIIASADTKPNAISDTKSDTRSVQQQAVWEAVNAVRKARSEGSSQPLMKVLSDVLSKGAFTPLKKLPDYKNNDDWTALLRLLRDKHLPGRNRWMHELLWYVRDFDLAKKAEEAVPLAVFTKAMVQASRPTDMAPQFPEARKDKTEKNYIDYASTGRPGNTYPSFEMLKHLADPDQPDKPLIKISSRGESGGTIDILEKAGIPLCRSEEAANTSLDTHGWALVETSEALGEVDKILMKLRKECGCMKVNHLTMTSISAKKAVMGIPSFDVQVVTGYDSKFHTLLGAADVTDISGKWSAMWKNVFADGEVEVSPFDSSQLISWKNNGDAPTIVFGQKLLAAKVWSDLSDDERKVLQGRLPTEFYEQMGKLREALKRIETAATSAPTVAGSCSHDDFILNLSRIVSPQYLKGVQCKELKCLADTDGFHDMAAFLFRLKYEDIFPEVHVPYFDGLYSEIAKSSHPMASILFGKNWLVVLRPRSDLPPDLQAWCWRVLRDGFGNTKVSTL